MRQATVVVVGAGIGGLGCAIDLAAAGFAVTVIERAERSGGKMREVDVGASRVDAGPTVLTMRWVFDALFESAGSALESQVGLSSLDVLARHAWSDRERLDLYADVERSADAIGDVAGAREAAGYRAFSAESRRIYETLKDTFLGAQTTGPVGLAGRIGPGKIGSLLALRPFETLWQALGDHFHDPRLRQLFGRYATYCGSSPFAAPATLMLIAHVEQAGVWCVEGGMQRLAEALERLAISLGVTFRHGADVRRIEVDGGRASGVTLAGGERIAADWVVVNAGAAALRSGVLGDAARTAPTGDAAAPRSLSAVTWALRTRATGFPLVRHNVFFSGDYAAEFADIFGHDRPPRAPTIYVCAQDRDDGGQDIAGDERLLVLMNAPAAGDRHAMDEEELAECETRVFGYLERCGLTLDRSQGTSAITTPVRFEAMFPGTGGALYGAATHGWAAAFDRPGARTTIPGLYLAGGGAHPGAGVPMAALSGRLAAQRLMTDRASTRRFLAGATFGGTSTRSATTADGA
jgi:1-hydroxycarotenoid 3,4-desaturase